MPLAAFGGSLHLTRAVIFTSASVRFLILLSLDILGSRSCSAEDMNCSLQMSRICQASSAMRSLNQNGWRNKSRDGHHCKLSPFPAALTVIYRWRTPMLLKGLAVLAIVFFLV